MQKNDNFKENQTQKDGRSFFDLAAILLANLPPRSGEIVKKRFGLADSKPETLEKIGKDYGITRERVRQIIADAIKKISKLGDTEEFQEAEGKIILEIDARDGIISDEELIRKLGSKNSKEANAIRFFAACSGKIEEAPEKDMFKESWVVSKNVTDKVKELSSVAGDVLAEAGRPLTDSEMAEMIGAKAEEFSKGQILNYLDVLSGISKNKFGKWGFSDWMEINPKGTRERIYLVLKEQGKPLHFTEIARLIDEMGIGKKKSHPQTVHNELIKDDRFVLIGRGIYALGEWGYEPGAIKDVLENILKKNGKPMTKEEILAEVSKIRQVKKTTVMINLNNNRRFIKEGNRYSFKK